MDNGIQLKYDTVHDGCLTLHHDIAKRFGITHPTEKVIRFGMQSFPAKIVPASTVQLNEASLSFDIKKKVGLPQNCHYEIRQVGKELQIGPYIGFLAGYYKKSIARKLGEIQDYLPHYPDIKGAILVFCIENIDQVNHMVNGYMYNPVTHSWDEGIFPYPSAIIVVSESVGRKWIHHFESIMGPKVFNLFNYTKWDVYKRLSNSIDVKSYLPQTILYESPQQLFSFLKKHPFVHVKSISIGKSPKNYRISREQFYFVISDQKKGKNTRINCINKDQAYEWFSSHLKEGEFIIQKSLDSNQIRSIDLRMIFVKDEQEKWKHMGSFGRKGTVDNVTLPMIRIEKDTLSEVLNQSDLISSLLIQEVQAVALDVIKALESSENHIANAAVDMIIDDRGRTWFCDIHFINPTDDTALVAGYPELYYGALKTNMLYAKKLADFL